MIYLHGKISWKIFSHALSFKSHMCPVLVGYLELMLTSSQQTGKVASFYNKRETH